MASRPGRTTLPVLRTWLNTKRSTVQISSSQTLKSMTRSARCGHLTVQPKLQRTERLEESPLFPNCSIVIYCTGSSRGIPSETCCNVHEHKADAVFVQVSAD